MVQYTNNDQLAGQFNEQLGGYLDQLMRFLNSSGIQQGQRKGNKRILGLLDRQLSESENIRNMQMQDRDRAISGLEGFGNDPFYSGLKGSIQDTIANPDVYSQEQIENFDARSRATASQGVQDALRTTRTGNAQRGVSGGIAQGAEQQLQMQAIANAIANRGNLEFGAAQARADNLARAQGLGSNISGLDQERALSISEILANTDYAMPDYSGMAGLLYEMFSGNDANLAAILGPALGGLFG